MHPNREVWVREPRQAGRSNFSPRNKYRPETHQAF
jgi:dihydroxy-acid dehydratase